MRQVPESIRAGSTGSDSPVLRPNRCCVNENVEPSRIKLHQRYKRDVKTLCHLTPSFGASIDDCNVAAGCCERDNGGSTSTPGADNSATSPFGIYTYTLQRRQGHHRGRSARPPHTPFRRTRVLGHSGTSRQRACSPCHRQGYVLVRRSHTKSAQVTTTRRPIFRLCEVEP